MFIGKQHGDNDALHDFALVARTRYRLDIGGMGVRPHLEPGYLVAAIYWAQRAR